MASRRSSKLAALNSLPAEILAAVCGHLSNVDLFVLSEACGRRLPGTPPIEAMCALVHTGPSLHPLIRSVTLDWGWGSERHGPPDRGCCPDDELRIMQILHTRGCPATCLAKRPAKSSAEIWREYWPKPKGGRASRRRR